MSPLSFAAGVLLGVIGGRLYEWWMSWRETCDQCGDRHATTYIIENRIHDSEGTVTLCDFHMEEMVNHVKQIVSGS